MLLNCSEFISAINQATPEPHNKRRQRVNNFVSLWCNFKLKFSSFIAEAAVIGSGKAFLSAIICIRYSVLSKWAENKRIAFTTYSDLAAKKEIEGLITEETAKVNNTLPENPDALHNMATDNATGKIYQ